MQSLTYISGPPCSGKSVVCRSLMKAFSGLKLITGDNYWNRNTGLSFEERTLRTNEMILQDILSMTQPHLLLEWVPASDVFCNRLRDVCLIQDRSFNHLVLYAQPNELRKRKLARDGDEDIVEPNVRLFNSLEDALVLETTALNEKELQIRCVEWFRSKCK